MLVHNKQFEIGEKTKNKRKIYIVTSLIIFGFLIFMIIMTTLGGYLYLNHFMRSKNAIKTETTFIVREGEDVRQITKNLQEKGLIKQDIPLLTYLKLNGLSGKIIAGEYRIMPESSPTQIIGTLTGGKVTTDKITIPEGWTNNQIGGYLEDKNIVTKADFLTAAKKIYDYDFLKDKPANVDLEGFLFPDTYQLPTKVTADLIVKKMLANFDNKLTNQLKTESLKSGLNMYQVVTLASIVEREVAKPEDRELVAGVFLSRLKENMPLESCATIQYILNANKTQFTYEETRTPSPYNTYLNPGLPLGPIGNPGLDSIKAVINPKITEYRYFLSANGITYFSKTFAEHEEKKAKYLQ
ncbi:MAG: endolytic transglycosylase MltG [bacterium]